MTRRRDPNSKPPRPLRDRTEAASPSSSTDLQTRLEEFDRFVHELETMRQQLGTTSGIGQKTADQNAPRLAIVQLEDDLLQFERSLLRRLEFEKFLFDLSRTFI